MVDFALAARLARITAPQTRVLLFDYETRSCADLEDVGAYEYARHPTTEIMCAAFRWGTRAELPAKPTRVWSNLLKNSGGGFGRIEWAEAWREMVFALQDPDTLFVAHNALFEQLITEYVLRPSLAKCCHYFPPLPPERWYCTAATASALALPRNLEGAAKALKLKAQKDAEGRRLMLKLSKPAKVSKERPVGGWYEDPDEVERLLAYCVTDIDVGVPLFLRLPPLTATERQVWELDQRINLRGLRIDRPLVKRVRGFIEEETKTLNAELVRLTDGKVERTSQRARVQAFFADQGFGLRDMKKETVESAIETAYMADDERCQRVLEIYAALSSTSVKKYPALDLRSATDGRCRDILMYHGASTGRWCLPETAEVLTRTGWAPIAQMPDTIAIWSLDTEEITFSAVTEWGKFDHVAAERFLCSEDRNFATAVTWDHRIPVKTVRRQDRWRFKEAWELKDSRTYIPVSGRLRGSFCPEIVTRILVMTQADGHYTKDPEKGLYLRFSFKKSRKIDRCKKLLQEASLPFRETTKHLDGRTIIKLRISDCPKWLSDFRSKTFQFQQCMDPTIFIDELPYWDGHRTKGLKSFEYCSTNRSNASFAQTQAHLAGFAARLEVRPRIEDQWNTAYRVYVRRVSRSSVRNWKVKQLKTKHVYCPQTTTGAFLVRYKGKISVTGNTGLGIQPQNLPRTTLPQAVIDHAIATIAEPETDTELLRDLYGALIKLFVNCIRGTIVPTEGSDFYCADYSAIEARVLFWVADHAAGVEAFAAGSPIYEMMAADIFGKSLLAVTKEDREVGKRAILGLGYQMGWKKFIGTCQQYAKITLPDELAEKAVKTYRRVHAPVARLWSNIQRAAIAAVENPGKIYRINHTAWNVNNGFLWCQLPSGRRLAYAEPTVQYELPAWGGEERRPVLYHWGVDPTTHQWLRSGTYGGRLVENVVQAIARDLMAAAMLRIEMAGWDLVLTVHDEILAEREKAMANLKEFVRLMEMVPSWAAGLPIKVAGWVGDRYRKG